MPFAQVTAAAAAGENPIGFLYNQAPALSGTAAYLFVNDQKTTDASRILYPVILHCTTTVNNI